MNSLCSMHQELYQKDMESACVYEEQTAIHELTQGIHMTQQLMVNLHSPEARELLIKEILTSYEKVLLVLRSGASAGQPWVPALPAPGLPEPSMLIMSPGVKEFEFDQPFTIQEEHNVISKKRKVSTIWEDQVTICSDNRFNTDDSYNCRKYGQKDVFGAKIPGSYNNSCSYPKVQKCMTTKQVQMIDDEDSRVFEIPNIAKLTCDAGAQSTVPQPSPEKHEIAPAQHNHHQPPPLNHGEMLSNLRANLSVNTSDLGGEIVTSSFSSPLTSSGLREDFRRFQHPNQYYDELLLVYSPQFISPEWGSSSSMDFAAIW